ncbi:hypothetical protein AK88_00080 [Plasmodium fragile]|uniref:Uncharacterized protein n=1 Tax=Plasmodium fragile TaxID=5857 RepID=A0A0D9QTM4_PLAFR|nr:uncharacterized protein AK88_00080 [Plasmodium fragile]KJP90232.1 hypothetical protein AK88_00080 [Plasmodium fragile]
MLKRTLDENTGACNHPPQKARSKSVSIFSFFKKKKKEKRNSNDSVISTSNDSFELAPGESNTKERNGKGGRERQNILDEESATESRKAKCKDNAANTARSQYTQNYNECQMMKNSHLKKKRESFFQKINILQKFKNYKKKNATSTFHAGHNTSSASAKDEDREEETSNFNKKGSSGYVDYTKMYTNLKQNKSYNIKDEISSLKHKAQILRNSIYFNGKKKADKGKLIHKKVNCSSEIIHYADERESSSCDANSLLTNFKMKSNKLKIDEDDSVDQMGKSGRAQQVERKYVFDRSSDVEVWDEGVVSDGLRSVRGNIHEQQGLNSNRNVIDFNEYAYEEKGQDEAYLAESNRAESVTSEGKNARNVGAGGQQDERDGRSGGQKRDPHMDRSLFHTQGEPKRTGDFSFSRANMELVRNVQSNINDNLRTINNYMQYSNNRGGANLKAYTRTEATTTQEGGKLISKEIITTTQYDKNTTNEDIHKGCSISNVHNSDQLSQGKNTLERIPSNMEENLEQKEIIIKLMYNNNGIFFDQDENGTGGVPSRRANTAKVSSYDEVNSRAYESKSVNVSRSGRTNLHPIRQQIICENVTNQQTCNNEFVNDAHKKFSSPKAIEGGKKDNIINKYLIDPLYNLFVQPKEETDEPNLRNNNISFLPPQGGRNYTSELQKTYRALYDIYDGLYACGMQYKAHPNTDGSMNMVHRSFTRNVDSNTGVSSSMQSRHIPMNNQMDGSGIYMCPLNRSKSMNKQNASPFEHIQNEASNLSVKDTHHGYLNKANLYNTHFNTFHLKENRREPTFRGRGNGNFLSMSAIANCYNGPIKNMCTFLDQNIVRGSYYPRHECLASKFTGRSYTFCKENQGYSVSPVGGQQSGIMKKSSTFHGYQNGVHKDGQPRGYAGAPPEITPMMTPVATGAQIPVATPQMHTLHNCNTYCPEVDGKSHQRVNQMCGTNNAANSLAKNGNLITYPQGNPTNVEGFFSSKGVANNWSEIGTNMGQAKQVSRSGPYAQNSKQVSNKNMRNCTPFHCMPYGEGRPNDSRNGYMSSNFYTPMERLKNEKLRRLQSYSSKSKASVCLSKSQGHGAIHANMLNEDNNGGVIKRAKSLNTARSSSAHLDVLDIYEECYVQNGEANGFVNGNKNDNNLGGGHKYIHSHRVDDAHLRDASSSGSSCSSDKKNLAHDGIEPPLIDRYRSINVGGSAPRGSCQLRENKQTFFRSSSSNDTIHENYPIEGPMFEGQERVDHPSLIHSSNDDDIELYAVSLEQDGDNSVFEVEHENGEAVTLDKDPYVNITNEEAPERKDKSVHQSSTEKVVSCDGNGDTPSVYLTYEGEEPLWTNQNPNVENNSFEDEYNCENGSNSSDLIAEKRPEKVNHHPVCSVMRHNFRREDGRRSRECLPSPVDDYLHSSVNYRQEKKLLNGNVKDTKWTHSSDDKKNDSTSYARTKCDEETKTEEAPNKENYNSKGKDSKLKKITNKKILRNGKVNPNSSKSKILPRVKSTCEEMKKKKGVVKKVSSAIATNLKRKKKDPRSEAINESTIIRPVTAKGRASPSVSPSKRNKIKPTSKSTNSRHGSETAKHFNIVNTVEESVQVNYNVGENKINYKKESIVSSSNAVCIVNKLEDETMQMRTRKRVGQIKNKNKDSRGGEAYSSTSIQREDCNIVGSFSSSSVPLWPDCNLVGSFSTMSIRRENCSIEKRYAYLGESPSDGNGASRVGSFSRRSLSARDSVEKMKKITKNGNFSEKQEKRVTAFSSTRVQLKKNKNAEKKKKKKHVCETEN